MLPLNRVGVLWLLSPEVVPQSICSNMNIWFSSKGPRSWKLFLPRQPRKLQFQLYRREIHPYHSRAAVIQHKPLPYCTLTVLLYEKAQCSVILSASPHNWELHGCSPIPTMQNACRQWSCHCCTARRALTMRNGPPLTWMEIKTELRLKQEWETYPKTDMTSSPFLPYHHWFLAFSLKATAGDWSRLLCGFPSWQ